MLGLLARWRLSPPWPGFGEPFNGQEVRQGVIEELLELFGADLIIETGTFLGDTTKSLARHGAPVVTAEINPVHFRVARLRLRSHRNVELLCGDSVAALGLAARRAENAKPFVYLDAHWYERNPLAEEVQIVLSSWSDALIAIDDFLVPGEPGYAYDEWRGELLSAEMLDLPEGAVLAYPATPAGRETGARRGAAFIARGPTAVSAFKRLTQGLLRLQNKDRARA